nr:MAG TPA: hypothetical protein [Caudoviricetes sp.]
MLISTRDNPLINDTCIIRPQQDESTILQYHGSRENFKEDCRCQNKSDYNLKKMTILDE